MRRKTTPKSPKDAAEAPRALVTILGESPLVEQYANLCARHGYRVVIRREAHSTETPELEASVETSRAIPREASVALELTNAESELKRRNVVEFDHMLPATCPVLSSSVTISASEQASWISNKHRLVGIGAFPTLVERPLVEVAPTVFSPRQTVDVAATFFRSIGKEIAIVQDRVGMVLPRILCQLVNESAFALTEDIAAPQDIDLAMKLGVHYPSGPIQWGEQIGFKQVCAVLAALERDLQEDRYRTSPLLRQMAMGGDWWKNRRQ